MIITRRHNKPHTQSLDSVSINFYSVISLATNNLHMGNKAFRLAVALFFSVIIFLVTIYPHSQKSSKPSQTLTIKKPHTKSSVSPFSEIFSPTTQPAVLDPPVTKFDQIYFAEQFEICAENPDVDLASFIQGYESLVLLLNKLGPAFHFITTDLTKKLDLLRNKRKHDLNNFPTLSKMILTEVDVINKFTKPDAQHHSGSRDFQLLQRAMKMLYLFLGKIIDDGEGTKSRRGNLGQMALEAYNESPLPNFHSWAIRQSMKFAVVALPNKSKFFEIIGGNDLANIKRAREAMQKVYRTSEGVFEKNNLMNLP